MNKNWLFWVCAIAIISSAVILTVGFMTKPMKTAEVARSAVDSGAIIPSEVDAALDQMQMAHVVFNTPTEMNINDVSTINLLLSFRAPLKSNIFSREQGSTARRTGVY